MKSPYILPAVTALVGFSIAWIAKPDAAAPLSGAKTNEPSAVIRPERSASGDGLPNSDSNRPAEVKAGDFPLADKAEQGPKTRDEARMLRLTEALGLSLDQQGSIISLIEDIQTKLDGNVPVIQDLATRGKAVEEGLASILSPEQLAKFQEIRARERDNRIEQRAQAQLMPAIQDIDLSPQQREEVLSRLRQKSKAEMQAIPAAATLLFDKSLLPTNNKELSVDGVLLLARANESVDLDDPMKAHQRVLDTHKRELEDILACYDGVLTPGQMGQYQAAMYERRQLTKRIPAPDVPDVPIEPDAVDGQAPPSE